MTGQLTYRLFRDSDLPGLLQLWEKNTKWGTLTPELWRQWYMETPDGPSLVAVALDENDDIAGQLIFTPSRVVVVEREVRALRLSAPILRKDLSGTSLHIMDHPLLGLYKVGEEAAIAGGYGLWYALPRYGWLPYFQWLSHFVVRKSHFAAQELAIAEYRCVESPVGQASPTVTTEAGFLTARPAMDFGMQYEMLWQCARDSFPITCGVVRSSSWLRYNNIRLLTLEVCDARDGTLVGYTVTRTRPPLLCDILALNPARLAPVLAATLDWFATRQGAAATDSVDRLDVMETPTLRPALHALGFTPVNYKFAFVCAMLDPSLPVAAIAPERWYIAPGDHGL
jgi:hypothetical protein